MKRFRLPPKLVNRGPLTQWLNELRACVESIQPLDSPSTKHTETTLGTLTRSKGGGGSSGPVSDWFKGEWSSSGTYAPGEGVVVRTGINAGLYLCVRDSTPVVGEPCDPAADPSLGIFWVQVADNYGLGMWS